jgi:hypothetical protein
MIAAFPRLTKITLTALAPSGAVIPAVSTVATTMMDIRRNAARRR